MIYYDIYKCDFAVFLGLDKGTGLLILQKSFSNCNRSSWGRKSSCLNHGLSTRSPLCCRYFLGRSSPADALSAGHVPWKPRSSFCSKHVMGKPWLQVSTPKMDQAGQSWQTGKEWIVIKKKHPQGPKPHSFPVRDGPWRIVFTQRLIHTWFKILGISDKNDSFSFRDVTPNIVLLPKVEICRNYASKLCVETC